ncbi:MAG: ABC transporter permease, partial [Bacteroidetes bacterium]
MELKQNKIIYKILRISEIGSLSALFIIVVTFSVLSEYFLTLANFVGIFTMTAELGIIAIGVTFLMISGEFDLSVGSVFAVAPMTGAILMNNGLNPFFAFLAGLLVAAIIGLMNGFVVIKTKIPSFIVTLGSMMFFRGLLLAVSGGFQISYFDENNYFLNALGGKIFLGMRASGIWFIIGTLFFSFILNHTKYGNHVFAVGGNQEAAEAIGINVNKVKIINFIACSVMAGLAGFTMFGRFNSIDPTAGLQLEL